MKHLKITIIGCSVALRVRPPEKKPDNKNYGQLLLDGLAEKYPDRFITVNNRAFTRATLKDIWPKIENVANDYPDFFVLNIGIPDASTRDIPKWVSDYISYKPDKFLSFVFSYLYNKLIKPNRKFFVKIRGYHTWVDLKKFEKLYRRVIEYILKETNASVIMIPINAPSKRIEKQLPGTQNNVVLYNEVIRKLASDYNISLISLDELDQSIHYPDGIHYSVHGHKIISEKILNVMISE